MDSAINKDLMESGKVSEDLIIKLLSSCCANMKSWSHVYVLQFVIQFR